MRVVGCVGKVLAMGVLGLLPGRSAVVGVPTLPTGTSAALILPDRPVMRRTSCTRGLSPGCCFGTVSSVRTKTKANSVDSAESRVTTAAFSSAVDRLRSRRTPFTHVPLTLVSVMVTLLPAPPLREMER